MFGALPVEVVYLILEYVDFIDLLHLKLVTKVPLFDVIHGRALTFRSRYDDVMRGGKMGMHFVKLTVQYLDEGDKSFHFISGITMYNCGFTSCSVFRRVEAFLAREQRNTSAKLIRQSW